MSRVIECQAVCRVFTLRHNRQILLKDRALGLFRPHLRERREHTAGSIGSLASWFTAFDYDCAQTGLRQSPCRGAANDAAANDRGIKCFFRFHLRAG